MLSFLLRDTKFCATKLTLFRGEKPHPGYGELVVVAIAPACGGCYNTSPPCPQKASKQSLGELTFFFCRYHCRATGLPPSDSRVKKKNHVSQKNNSKVLKAEAHYYCPLLLPRKAMNFLQTFRGGEPHYHRPNNTTHPTPSSPTSKITRTLVGTVDW